MPLFNKAPHVVAAVTSALNQSLSPAEVVVVDDGSTDSSLEQVRSIDDPRLTILTRSPPGPGGYAARNLGIEASKGDWVAFLDADDLWHDRHLENLAAAIDAAGKDAGCAFAGADLVYSDRRNPRVISTRHLKPRTRLGPDAILRAWLESRECPLWTSAVAVRRQLLFDAGLFPAGRARRGGDKDLWLRVTMLTDCVYSGAVTAEFHQDSINRLSKSTVHSDPPILAETVRALLPATRAELRPLLRRLSNMEVVGYARYSAGRGKPVFRRFARLLHYPAGLVALGKLAAYGAAGIVVGALRTRSSAAESRA